MEGRGSVSENRWPLSILRNDFHHVFVFLFGFQKIKVPFPQKKNLDIHPNPPQPSPRCEESVSGWLFATTVRLLISKALAACAASRPRFCASGAALAHAGCPEGCGKITGKTPKSYAHVLNPIFRQQWSQFVKQQIVPLEGFERLSHRCFGCIANSSMIQLRTVTIGNPKTKTCCMLAQGTPDMLLMSSSMTFTASASEAFKSLEKPQVSSA